MRLPFPFFRKKRKPRFSSLEKMLLQLLVRDYSSADIALELAVSENFVDVQKQLLQQKMGVATEVGMVLYAVRHKLVSLEEGEGS